MPIIPENYVVLDVETNGLSSLRDDLLSISIYQPDTHRMYNRFLPLELNRDVYTTHINGITKKDLKKATPLTQEEINQLISDFELHRRTILTYGSIDEKFVRNYFKRKGLSGFDQLKFFNFKRNIISSRFSDGSISKDNLCRLFGIENVQDLHSGVNDCLLEWKLFEKLNGNKLLITYNKVFELNDDYIVPASYLANYPNFKYHTQNLPKFKCSAKTVKRFTVTGQAIKKFPTNFNGLTIEHLINTMLDAERVDSSAFLVQNKSKLKYIGKLPSPYDEIYMNFNADGTVSAVADKDKKLATELNAFILLLKKEITPLVNFIKKSIFHNQHILSQELVIHKDKNVLALCDLSSEDAVLEIKTYGILNLDTVGDQLFYESNGRACYVLQIEWSLKKMSFVISKVEFEIDNSLPVNSLESRIANFLQRIENKQVDVVEYIDSYSKVTLRCHQCGNTFSKSYNAMLKRSQCPYCNPNISQANSSQRSKETAMNAEEKKANRAASYFERVKENSGGSVTALTYNGAKEKLTAMCNYCGHQWDIRADHLLTRAYCPKCRRSKA